MNPPPGNKDLIRPAGPVDPGLSLLAVRAPSGAPIALLANYSLHYVGGIPRGVVSADYFAAFAQEMAARLKTQGQDPPFVGIMANGTMGDVNNIDFRTRRPVHPPFEKLRQVAAVVADEAERVFGNIKYHDHVPIAHRQARLPLGVRLPTKQEVEWAKGVLAHVPVSTNRLTRPQVYARETMQMSDWADRYQAVVQAVRIGELGIVALPCEVFAATGLELKAKSPLQPTFTVSLANGYGGYLPTPEQHRLGGYETWRARSSFLEVDAEPKLRDKALELLAAIA